MSILILTSKDLHLSSQHKELDDIDVHDFESTLVPLALTKKVEVFFRDDRKTNAHLRLGVVVDNRNETHAPGKQVSWEYLAAKASPAGALVDGFERKKGFAAEYAGHMLRPSEERSAGEEVLDNLCEEMVDEELEQHRPLIKRDIVSARPYKEEESMVAPLEEVAVVFSDAMMERTLDQSSHNLFTEPNLNGDAYDKEAMMEAVEKWREAMEKVMPPMNFPADYLRVEGPSPPALEDLIKCQPMVEGEIIEPESFNIPDLRGKFLREEEEDTGGNVMFGNEEI